MPSWARSREGSLTREQAGADDTGQKKRRKLLGRLEREVD
jgi:hypothetical protein